MTTLTLAQGPIFEDLSPEDLADNYYDNGCLWDDEDDRESPKPSLRDGLVAIWPLWNPVMDDTPGWHHVAATWVE